MKGRQWKGGHVHVGKERGTVWHRDGASVRMGGGGQFADGGGG